jgi:ribosome-binding factor A
MQKGIQAARLADQIRDYLAHWSQADLPGYFFSITQVTFSPSLQDATIWLDILDVTTADRVVSGFNRLLPGYQRRLHQALQKRALPRLHISLESTPLLDM